MIRCWYRYETPFSRSGNPTERKKENRKTLRRRTLRLYIDRLKSNISRKGIKTKRFTGSKCYFCRGKKQHVLDFDLKRVLHPVRRNHKMW